MTTLKKKGALLLLVIMTIAAVWIPVYAADDNYGYAFNLKTNYNDSYTSGRYRQTTNLENKWKVEMNYNSRGASSRINYWLAKTTNKVRVSNIRTVTTKTGAVYTNAWSGASQTDVSLGAEAYLDEGPTVAGFWDEETN